MSKGESIIQTLIETFLKRQCIIKWSTALGGTLALSKGVHVGQKNVDPIAIAETEGKVMAGSVPLLLDVHKERSPK